MIKVILDMIMSLFGSHQSSPIEEVKPEVVVKKPFEVKSLIGKLATHPTKTWNTRSLGGIENVAVHQVGGPGDIEGIAKYHTRPGPQNHLSEDGAPSICYHYGIAKDGTCYHLTEDKYLTWHCANRNARSLGVLVEGNFDGPGHEGTEKPTEEQLEALPKLLDYLKEKYPAVKVLGHCELAVASHKKDYCPGTIVMEAINAYRS